LNYPAGVVKVTEVTQKDLDDFKLNPSNTRTEKYIREVSNQTFIADHLIVYPCFNRYCVRQLYSFNR
jgi:hypothetical protein